MAATDASFSSADIPEDTGVDHEALRQLVALEKEYETDALVVVKNGVLVGSWNWSKSQSRIETMSVTKSVVGMAIGSLLQEGLLSSVDEPVHTFYPEWNQGRKKGITIRHILSHTSGLQDLSTTYKEILPSRDYVQLALAAELSADPGERFFYSNKAVNLLAGIIHKISGKRMDEYIAEAIFMPLGIVDYDWQLDRSGNPHAMAGLEISAVDLSRLGQLMLNSGVWEGRRILSENWIRESTLPHGSAHHGLLWWLKPEWTKSTITDELINKWRNGGVPEEVIDKLSPLKDVIYSNDDYEKKLLEIFGSQKEMQESFWDNTVGKGLPERKAISGPLFSYEANGWLGQYLVVIPRHNLVVVRQVVKPKEQGLVDELEKRTRKHKYKFHGAVKALVD